MRYNPYLDGQDEDDGRDVVAWTVAGALVGLAALAWWLLW